MNKMIFEHFISKLAIGFQLPQMFYEIIPKIVMRIMVFNLSGAFSINLKWKSFFEYYVIFHIKWSLQVQILFIFYYYVVQNYISHHDVSYGFLVPLFTRVCYNPKSHL